MGENLAAAMPAELDLGNGWTLRLTAHDPTTGAVVSGVTVSNLRLGVINVGGTPDQQLAVGPYLLVPGSGA